MMLRELWYLFPKLIEEAKNDFKLKRKPRLRRISHQDYAKIILF